MNGCHHFHIIFIYRFRIAVNNGTHTHTHTQIHVKWRMALMKCIEFARNHNKYTFILSIRHIFLSLHPNLLALNRYIMVIKSIWNCYFYGLQLHADVRSMQLIHRIHYCLCACIYSLDELAWNVFDVVIKINRVVKSIHFFVIKWKCTITSVVFPPSSIFYTFIHRYSCCIPIRWNEKRSVNAFACEILKVYQRANTCFTM